MMTAEEMAQRIAEREQPVSVVVRMADRISQQESAVTAAGPNQSWRWQLRDRNGKWIQMGAKVQWYANGKTRLGRVVGSHKEGEAEVEEENTNRRVRILTNRLSVREEKRDRSMMPQQTPAEPATAGREGKAVVAKSTGSQPEPDTLAEPEPPPLKATQDDYTAGMSEEQYKALTEGVKLPKAKKTDSPGKKAVLETLRAGGRKDDGTFPYPKTIEEGATGTEDDPIWVGTDVALAQRLLMEDKFIRMAREEDLINVLDKEFATELAAAGKEKLNMCLVQVQGKNLFCQEDKDIRRVFMPQAEGEDVETDVKKNVQPWLEGMLEEFGMIRNEIEEVDPRTQKASQNELLTGQIISMATNAKKWLDMTEQADALRAEGKTAEADAIIAERDAGTQTEPPTVMPLSVLTEVILTTHDKYIVDGHHRWAAMILLNQVLAKEGKPPVKMKVRKITMEIGETLAVVNAFTKAAGIKPKAAGTAVGELPEILRTSTVPAQLEQWMIDNMERVKAELGPISQALNPDGTVDKVRLKKLWKAASAAKKKQIAAKLKIVTASAGEVEDDDVILADGIPQWVRRIVVETSGGRTFLQQDVLTGELSLAILASAAPVYRLDRSA
jgi:hypothetical protein